MQRPATWKILTIGAALTGLSLAGAGSAFADSGQSVSVAAPGGFSTDSPYDDLLDDVDDLAQGPYEIPWDFVGFDDDWYGDDDWGDD